jgi:hypothetical protein
MKLFRGHEDLEEPDTLRLIVKDAIAQQPLVLYAFLKQVRLGLD